MASGLAGLPVLIYGGGELGTAVALRFWRAGLRVLVVERPGATALCQGLSLAAAVIESRPMPVGGVTGVGAQGILQAEDILGRGQVPVMVAPTPPMIARFAARVLVDATNPRAPASAFPPKMTAVTVALGPGRMVGSEAAAVVDTSLTQSLGNVLYAGEAKPGPVPPNAFHPVQVVHTTAPGVFVSEAAIGDAVAEGAVLGYVGSRPVTAPRDGYVRGLLADGLRAQTGQAVAELWLGEDASGCYGVSPWARAVAGGALEAVMHLVAGRGD